MSQNSRINITGKNFLIALSIALVITSVFVILGSLGKMFFSFNETGKIDFLMFANYSIQNVWAAFKSVGLCVVPIVFLLSFALLQRFRIKD